MGQDRQNTLSDHGDYKLMEMRNAGPCALDIQVRQINDALVQAAEEVRSKTVKRHRKARLIVWTQEIKEALSSKKKAFWEWKQNNRPNHEGNVFVTNKNLTTRHLRKLCRMESANIRGAARQQILDARTSVTKMFHKLIDKQRGKVTFGVSELHVGEFTYSTSSGVLQGWREHFSKLATPDSICTMNSDPAYQKPIKTEMPQIVDINISRTSTASESVTVEEVEEAVLSLKHGKAADVYGIVAEHILYGGDHLLQELTTIINSLFAVGEIPDTLKLGILTPVYKRKGLNTEAKNYRGITILPVITKSLEAVLRSKIQPIINAQQNPVKSVVLPVPYHMRELKDCDIQIKVESAFCV